MRKTVQIQELLKKEYSHLTFSELQIEQIRSFLDLLSHWNQKINLTAITDPDTLFAKHILDSLAILLDESDTSVFSGRVADIGSGAGLPGIVLSIVRPELQLYSIEKTQKKITFQQVVKANLKLTSFYPIATKVETLISQVNHHQTYDHVVSRAFTQIGDLLRHSAALLKVNGEAIFWKGELWRNEWQNTPEDIRLLFSEPAISPYQFKSHDTGGFIVRFKRC